MITGGFLIRKAGTMLLEIGNLNDPNCIGLLISLPDDNCKYSEFMFSIICTIEKFDDRIYIKQVVSNIPEFINKSSEWDSIIYNRL